MNKRVAWQASWVEKWPSFVAAGNVLEVGSGTFETIAHLAKAYPDKQFYGVDFELRPQAVSVAENAPDNLVILKQDVRDLCSLPENHFDFAFSVALIEHIRELDAHLKEIYRVLKEGGCYCFMAAPLWSSSLGHHCDHNAPDCPIPYYSHLYMTREQLGDFLITQAGKSPHESAQILRRVYDRKDLSRLSRSQIRKFAEQSPLRIASWKENKDKNYDNRLAKTVLQNNLYGLEASDLQISTVLCCLIKAGEGYKSCRTDFFRLSRFAFLPFAIILQRFRKRMAKGK